MSGIKYFKNEDIKKSLEGLTRQYFVGDLKRPQILDFLKSNDLEIGITSYDDYTSEQTHIHSKAIEYQYMISGRTQYMDIDTRVVFDFIKGDFFAIYPNTAYAQRSKPGTSILFIKVPSINDKQIVETDDRIKEWLSQKLTTERRDFYYCKDAPIPNSIKPAAAVAIVESGKLLMLRRSDNGKWTMPGGTMDFGESIHDCAIREIKEESGLTISITDIIGTYSNPNIIVAYSDGEVRQEFTVLYKGEVLGGNINLDSESTAYRWVPLNEVKSIDMTNSQLKRVNDVIEYLLNGKKKLL